jgi:hypothetical protein
MHGGSAGGRGETADMQSLVAASLWGFLVGFVGWAGCFLMAEPVAAWLLRDTRASGNVVGVARALIVLFALLAVFVAVSLVPLMQVTFLLIRSEEVGPGVWRRLFGASYMSSLLGLLALALLRWFAAKTSRRRR